MKIFNQIFVVGFFILIIFIIKTDYMSIYSKTLTYLKEEVNISSDFYKNTLDNAKEVINKNKELPKKIETPGALVVPDNYLTYNTKSINLSSKNVIDITNKQRTDNGGLAILKENSKLDFSAEKKLQDMFMKQYFEHVSPDGVGVGDLGTQAGYEYIIIGENLALGNFKDDKSLVDAWMNSPGHRANILNTRYTEIGVAVGSGIYNGKTIWMAVQHFGLPKSACPSIDPILKGIIDIDQKNVKAMEGDIALKKAKIDSGEVYNGLTTNEQVAIYNTLVNNYNKLITDVKEKINKYNEEVRNYNSCIGEVN